MADRKTTILIHREIRDSLKSLKRVRRESYDEILHHLMDVLGSRLESAKIEAPKRLWDNQRRGKLVTIGIRKETLERLRALKITRSETYSEVIARLQVSYQDLHKESAGGRPGGRGEKLV
jgi:predicted CopG family antitoxin